MGEWEFRVLGCLEALIDGQVADIPGRKPRLLLAALLTHANQFVTSHFLADALWDADPPPSAATTLRGYVSALRSALRAEGGDEGADVLETKVGGYQLTVAGDRLDCEVFLDLAAQGRAERDSGDLARAAETFQRALALWRGDVLADVNLRWLQHSFAPRLRAQRLMILAERIDVALELGRYREVLPELEGLVAEHPLDERFRAQLMRALYLAGRPSEALATYQRAREQLIEETGLSPGPELQGTQRAMLRGEPVLGPDAGESKEIQPAGSPSGPCELPPVVPDFVGRERALAEAAAHCLDQPDSRRAHARTVVITGPPGIGKTSAGAELAHQLKGRFADGQLCAQLDDGGGAQDAEAVLGRWMHALGAGPEERRGGLVPMQSSFRRLTADRRVMLLIDGASSEEVVRQLLPGGANCAVIVTSREPLGGLAGAHRVRLAPLSEAEALELLSRIIGNETVQADLAAARRLAQLCDRLPLALRVAGARLAARPGLALASHVQRLEDPGVRLRELTSGEVSVADAVGAAVGHCCPTERRLLALAAGRPHDALGPDAAAEMLGVPRGEAEVALHGLAERGLLGERDPTSGGFPIRELARAYAPSLRRAQAGRALTGQPVT